MATWIRKIFALFKPLSAFIKGGNLAIIIVSLVMIVLIWSIGHKFSFDEKPLLNSFSAKMSATLALIMLGMLIGAILRAAGKKADADNPEAAEARRLKAEAAQKTRENKNIIRRKLDEAIRNTRSRYALPWYLLIGPGNSGKTSALLSSGLKFPLNEEADRAVSPLAETGRLDVFYGNQAVFLDTPGAYTESAPKTPEHELWLALLKGIFRARPGRPLNGVIVCLSWPDLMSSDRERREHMARLIRERLSEISRRLHVKVPVYLLLTKGDEVQGFAQFFSRLSRVEREQICGALSEDEQPQDGQIRLKITQLLATFNTQLIDKLHNERDLAARSALFHFPQSLYGAAPYLEDFVAEAFGESRYHPRTLFRGFFLTSALTGSEAPPPALNRRPIRSLDSLQLRSPDYGRGFFLSSLFQNFFISEAGLAGIKRRGRWFWATWYRAGKLMALAGFAVLLFFLARSFENNFARLQTIEKIYAGFSQTWEKTPMPYEARQLLPELEKLQAAAAVFDPERDSYLKFGFGLYQGEKARRATLNAWRNLLNRRLLPLLRFGADQKVRQNLDDLQELKNSLRAYLMLHKPKYLEDSFLNSWQAKNWSYQYQGYADIQSRLMVQLGALIRLGIIPGEMNPSLMATARQAMFKLPPAELAYQMMREEAANTGRRPFMFRDVLGPEMALFVGDAYQVPYFFTRSGFEDILVSRGPRIIKSLTADNWIFGEGEDSWSLNELDVKRIHVDVSRLYYRDYINYWSEALKALEIPNPKTIAEAGRQSEAIGGGRAPVVSILRALNEHVSLSDDLIPPEPPVQTPAEETAGQEEAVAPVVSAAEPPLPPADAAMVRNYFTSFTALLLTDGQAGALVGGANEAAVAAGNFFTLLAASDNKDEKILEALIALADESEGALRRLEMAASKLPPDVGRWYRSILDGGLADLRLRGANYLDSLYRETVLSSYNGALRDKYPFNPSSAQDVNLNDFIEFFKQDGVAANYIGVFLKPFMNPAGGLRNIMGRPLPLSPKALEQLTRSTAVRDAFFTDGSELGLNFVLSPNTMDPQLKTATLSYDNKVLRYWHGLPLSERYVWPGAHRSSLVFEDLSGVLSERTAQGEWSVFRLFQRGAPQSPNVIQVNINDRWIRFSFNFRNRVNPFSPAVLYYKPPDSLR